MGRVNFTTKILVAGKEEGREACIGGGGIKWFFIA